MKIYLVCSMVDQGYWVQHALLDEKKAEEKIKELTDKHYADGWEYDPQYFIESLEIE